MPSEHPRAGRNRNQRRSGARLRDHHSDRNRASCRILQFLRKGILTALQNLRTASRRTLPRATARGTWLEELGRDDLTETPCPAGRENRKRYPASDSNPTRCHADGAFGTLLALANVTRSSASGSVPRLQYKGSKSEKSHFNRNQSLCRCMVGQRVGPGTADRRRSKRYAVRTNPRGRPQRHACLPRPSVRSRVGRSTVTTMLQSQRPRRQGPERKGSEREGTGRPASMQRPTLRSRLAQVRRLHSGLPPSLRPGKVRSRKVRPGKLLPRKVRSGSVRPRTGTWCCESSRFAIGTCDRFDRLPSTLWQGSWAGSRQGTGSR